MSFTVNLHSSPVKQICVITVTDVDNFAKWLSQPSGAEFEMAQYSNLLTIG